MEQKSRTGNPDSNWITRQQKLNSLAGFMRNESINPKLRQNQIAKELGSSNSTLQRYRKDKKMQCMVPKKLTKLQMMLTPRTVHRVNNKSKDLN